MDGTLSYFPPSGITRYNQTLSLNCSAAYSRAERLPTPSIPSASCNPCLLNQTSTRSLETSLTQTLPFRYHGIAHPTIRRSSNLNKAPQRPTVHQMRKLECPTEMRPLLAEALASKFERIQPPICLANSTPITLLRQPRRISPQEKGCAPAVQTSKIV